jgi:SAM-dependent methyltransferase
MGVPTFKYPAITCVVIGLALITKRFVLPRLLRTWFGVKQSAGEPRHWRDSVQLRYQNLHTSVWMFAWFKLRLDPMFRELPQFLAAMPKIRTAFDLGCGYGIAGSSILQWNPELKLYGVDPSPKRVRAASRAFGQRGEVFRAAAPDFEVPRLPARLDAVFCLDVIHFLPDSALDLTLCRIRARLDEGGYLLVRAPMPPMGLGSLLWNVDKVRRRLTGAYARYRTVDQIGEALTRAGFRISSSQISGTNAELHWFLAVASSPNESSRLRPESQPAHTSQHNQDDQNRGGQVGHNQCARVVFTELVPSL